LKPETDPRQIRLQKVIAEAGLMSRRAAEDLIRQGRVIVNGERPELGRRVDPDSDVIEVDGSRLPTARGHIYLMINKPKGVLTTLRDPHGRPTVADLIPPGKRLFPVGRLDADTEGLVFFTNDGELAHRLTHPSFEVPKKYVAEVDGSMSTSAVRRLEDGVRIDRGRRARADKARIKNVKEGRNPRTMIEVTLHEGRKHVVKLMLAAIDHPVRRLVRTGLGPLKLGTLRPGSSRKLTAEEISALYRAAGL
jgi:23S rRNA pseudouridine2605 synthase